mgnify:CR=1 FL=1
MSIFNDDDLFIICRPGDGEEEEPNHYKVTFKDLKEAILEVDDVSTNENTTSTELFAVEAEVMKSYP